MQYQWLGMYRVRQLSTSVPRRAGMAFPSWKKGKDEGVWTVLRSWVGKPGPMGPTDSSQNRGSPNVSEGSGRIEQVAEGLGTVDDWKEAEQRVKNSTEFEVINPGPSALLHVKMLGSGRAFAQVGSLLAKSPGVSSHMVLNGGPFHGALRKLGGGQLFLEKLSNASKLGSVDFVVSPAHQSDIALLKLDSSTEYAIRSDSALAFTEHLTLGMRWRGASRSIVDYLFSGSGTVAITGCGGIYRFCLSPRETYLVSARHLVAYDTGIRVSKPFTFSQKDENLPPPFWRQKDLRTCLSSIKHYALHYARRLSGKKQMHMLEGPGDFYLSARPTPTLTRIRHYSEARPTYLPESQKTVKATSIHSTQSSLQTDELRSQTKPANIVAAAKSITQKHE